MFDQRRKEEALVAVLQVHHVQVALERVRLAADVVDDALDLEGLTDWLGGGQRG